MRTPILAALALLLLAAPDQAAAQASCGDGKLVYETADRCRATYIDVLTGDRQWISIEEGQSACFVPGDHMWEWKCRGYTEAARCRRVRTKRPPLVGVEVRGGEVIWSCYER